MYVTGKRELLLYSTIQVLPSWQESEFKGSHLFSVAQQPYFGLGRLVFEVSISRTIRQTHPVGLMCTSGQPIAKADT